MTVIDKAFQNHKRAQYEQARQQEINAWRTEGRAIKVSNSGGVSAVEVVV